MRGVCNHAMPVITPSHVVRAFRHTWLLSVTGILWRRHSPNRSSRSGSEPSRCGKYTAQQGFLLRFNHDVFLRPQTFIFFLMYPYCQTNNTSLPGETSFPPRNKRAWEYVHAHLCIDSLLHGRINCYVMFAGSILTADRRYSCEGRVEPRRVRRQLIQLNLYVAHHY